MRHSLGILGLLIYLLLPWALADAAVVFSPSPVARRFLSNSSASLTSNPPSTAPLSTDSCSALPTCSSRILPYSRTLTIVVVGIFVGCIAIASLSVYARRLCLREGNLRHQNIESSGENKGNGALMKTLPVVAYEVPGDEGRRIAQECAVCLSEFQKGEMVRILPLCSHRFHRDCVDMWLFSHTTCPLCRVSVLKPKKGSLISRLLQNLYPNTNLPARTVLSPGQPQFRQSDHDQ